jgi:hypothetical protein
LARFEEQPPHPRRSLVGQEAGRQHDAKPASPARELHGALEKDLIEIYMPIGLGPVRSCIFDESCSLTSCPTIGCPTGIGTEHVPWRVSNDSIEPRFAEALAVGINECFRELKDPMKEPFTIGRPARDGEKPVDYGRWQCRMPVQLVVGDCRIDPRRWGIIFRPEPARTP